MAVTCMNSGSLYSEKGCTVPECKYEFGNSMGKLNNNTGNSW